METLYYGGVIRTMEADAPLAEALLVRDGVIAAVGGRDEVSAQCGPDAERVDLNGRVLLPAFLDPHSHLSAVANGLLQVPLDGAQCLNDVSDRIASYLREHHIPPGQWVFAKGYDHNHLKEQCHPSCTVLDAAAPHNPVMIVHQSGHMGVFNSQALQALGVTPDTPAPEGGKIGVENGALTGYMEENAFLHYQKKVPMPDLDALLDAFRQAQDIYASHGITTVQEGMMTAELLPIYQALLDRDALKLDVVGYADLAAADAIRAAFPHAIRRYDRHFKLGGYKIFLDGSPQGRTAWMRRPYCGGEPDDRGYGTMETAAVCAAVRRAVNEQMQLLAHCNGDAAAAQYLSVIAEAERAGIPVAGIRPVLIHGQLLGVDQLPEVKRLGVIPSFFVAHVYHWGDVHVKNFGMERARHISPAGSALHLGIPFTFHQDAPVIPPDMLETIWVAANRVTRGGVLLGPEERISAQAALAAVTRNAAYQYFEEGCKGTLKAGKRADLVMLDRDPVTTPAEALHTIRVLETIKDGAVIYRV